METLTHIDRKSYMKEWHDFSTFVHKAMEATFFWE